jgi:Cu(I)/Ag(I) efflux system membrane protein CusA/SilA
MYFMKITSNIMSLGGIAIAIGAMVDASIVLTENAHKHLEVWDKGGRKEPRDSILLPAMKEVGRPIFFSLLVIAISFLPIFTLEAQEGKLFQPLAFTKTFAMAFAAVLAVTLAPALVSIFLRGKFRPEEKHPVSRFLFRLYKPVVNFVIKHKYAVVITAAGLIVASLPLYFMLGSEFMPPLNEGSILYMPTTMPGLSVTQAADLLQRQDKVLSSFPEVERVFGKAGRAETATDPAPFSMMETVVLLKPESQWSYAPRWYSNWAPEFLKVILRLIWPERKTWDGLLDEMDRKMQFAGVSNAWTMPIKARIDMLSTGIRTPVGIKVSGPDLDTVQMIGEHIETALRDVQGTRSVYSERVAGGYYVDFDIDRPAIARYGLTVDDVQMVIMSAVGGENVSTTIEGRERYPVNVRYPRELRDNLEKLGRVLVATPSGAQIPLAQLADIHLSFGPSMIRDENGLLTGYVYVDIKDRDIGRYVKDAKHVISNQISLPHGYSLSWSGQYEYMERVKQRLLWIVPLTFFLVFLLLYFNTRSVIKTLIVLLAVPFSLIGAFAILYILGYNMSIAVWVGIIALAGVDAETGVVMLLYLDLAYKRMKDEGRMRTADDLKSAVIEGAVKRIRPKMMTVGTTFIGLLPIMWASSSQAGADVMKRIAAPMVGGIFTSFLMELVVYPAIFFIWRWHFDMHKIEDEGEAKSKVGKSTRGKRERRKQLS